MVSAILDGLQQVGIGLFRFPVYLILLFLGILVAALSEQEVTLLVILGVIVGIVTTATTGLIVAFGIYTIVLIGANWVSGLNREINFLSRVIRDNWK